MLVCSDIPFVPHELSTRVFWFDHSSNCSTDKFENYNIDLSENRDERESDDNDSEPDFIIDLSWTEDPDPPNPTSELSILSMTTVPRRRWRNETTVSQRESWEEVIAYSITVTNFDIPTSYRDAQRHPDWPLWKAATEKELASLDERGTWEIVDIPKGVKPLGSKLVYALKYLADGSVERHKARLVARGDRQKEGHDFDDTYSPVVRMSTFRLLLAIAMQRGAKVHMLDVETAYLYGYVDKEIYMEIPDCHKDYKPGKCAKLIKAIYGLKQAGRLWYQRLADFLLKLGFTQSDGDQCLFFKRFESKKDGFDDLCILSLYVDDIVIIANESMDWIKKQLASEFKIRDLGQLKKYLGIVFDWSVDGKHLFMHQTVYAKQVLKRFGMETCRPCPTPIEKGQLCAASRRPDEPPLDESTPYRSAVGALFYLLITRPELAYALSIVSRHCHDPCERHWAAVKRILRYVAGTTELGVHFVNTVSNVLSTNTDSSHNQDEGRGQGGYVARLGPNPISWWSGRFTLVGLSPQENEIMGMSEGFREVKSLHYICEDLGFSIALPFIIRTDSMGGIQAMQNGKRTKRNKHMDPRFFSMRRELEAKLLEFIHTRTQYMDSDVFTKALGIPEFRNFRTCLGVVLRSSIETSGWV